MEIENKKTKRLVVSAVMIGIATVIAYLCELMPFLNLPFGGGFTVASMLPIVIIAYMYGVKWGLFCGLTYSFVQMLIGIKTVSAFFTPESDSYTLLWKAILILLFDYVLAYTSLGFGGLFRKMKSRTKALVLGVIIALLLRYFCHIVSGAIFFGQWAEWFFTQEGFYSWGSWILEHFNGMALAVIYSVLYNGLYMIPEIVITAFAAVAVSRIPFIKKQEI